MWNGYRATTYHFTALFYALAKTGNVVILCQFLSAGVEATLNLVICPYSIISGYDMRLVYCMPEEALTIVCDKHLSIVTGAGRVCNGYRIDRCRINRYRIGRTNNLLIALFFVRLRRWVVFKVSSVCSWFGNGPFLCISCISRDSVLLDGLPSIHRMVTYYCLAVENTNSTASDEVNRLATVRQGATIHAAPKVRPHSSRQFARSNFVVADNLIGLTWTV
jgi:hypothetical protein